MLIHPLNFEQFGQRGRENLLNIVLDDSRVPMKQTRAHEMNKQPRNETRLNLKLTPKKQRG